ncbi:MAG: hypothetical protein M3452_09740 [Chloroflexota bacterium]|nr:hypothetical protein [Chloroflexota bacterium]
MSPVGDTAADVPDETLAALFERLAQELADVTTTGLSGRTDYARGGQAFASVAGGAADVRLHPEVAEAATRTSHTTISGRGPGWVRFAPPAVDAFALDRAGAWFLSAWRAAER